MISEKIESLVKSCYSTWSQSYYEDYYGEKAAYPPVHRDLLKGFLLKHDVKVLLDAGCGPASFLRDLADTSIEFYGFDLTPEMVAEGKKVMASMGRPAERIWEGSVLDPNSYRPPDEGSEKLFDAAICIGVLPHIPEDSEVTVLTNLRNAVRKGGWVIVEARNQLFSLFTANRYTYEFITSCLIPMEKLESRLGEKREDLTAALANFQRLFRMDLPPRRKGKQGEPGYDEVLSRSHNPFVLRERFAQLGFAEVRTLFYHYHCLPPVFAGDFPELFREESLTMENPDDWRGHFMASAFIMVGRVP